MFDLSFQDGSDFCLFPILILFSHFYSSFCFLSYFFSIFICQITLFCL
nr:MAG TPA: hypothetical protein [Caudoviricetes sp.]